MISWIKERFWDAVELLEIAIILPLIFIGGIVVLFKVVFLGWK